MVDIYPTSLAGVLSPTLSTPSFKRTFHATVSTRPGIQNHQINTRRSVFRRFKSAIVAAFAFYPPAANEEEARRMLMEWLAQIAIERGEYPVDDRRHPVYPCMAVNPDNASITESEYSLELDENKDLMLEVMPDCEGSTDGAYHRGDAGAQVMYDR